MRPTRALLIAALLGCSSDNSSPAGPIEGGSTKIVFVTSAQFPATLGGIAGADARCATAASGANLSGTFQAWLSDESTNAIDHVTGSGPWHLVNQVVAFNNRANLSTAPVVPLDRNEHGGLVTNGQVWTATHTGGTKASTSCSNWSGQSGSVWIGNTSDKTFWTEHRTDICGQTFRLYCFQV